MPEDSTSELRDPASQTVDDLKALLREAESALANVGSTAGDEISNLRERLHTALADGKNTLGRAADLARRQAARADELVRANPYASIGIASATGLVVGYLIARGCCRN
jgi:ElaB/YqjD/DUF883 family membrane-anchored ribosome-binding protein